LAKHWKTLMAHLVLLKLLLVDTNLSASLTH
jgi:hypothetical protein